MVSESGQKQWATLPVYSVQARRVGLLGGTFDPVHLGHMEMAQTALDEFALDEVYLMPANQPPHKRRMISSTHRLGMLREACRQMGPRFVPSTLELDRPGPTYTIDTLRVWREQFPGQTQYFFLIGADTLLELTTWRDFQQVLALTAFLVFPRPGVDMSAAARFADELARQYGGQFVFSSHMCADISSTSIRELVRAGFSVEQLAGPAVSDYIARHSLYTGEQNGDAS